MLWAVLDMARIHVPIWLAIMAHAVYWTMAHTPIGVAMVALVYGAITILFRGRMRFEGFPYNVLFSSNEGDLFLSGIIVVAIEALQREGLEALPPAATNIWFQAFWIGGTIVLVAV